MKIGIDARLLERPMTGIGRYLLNLLRYLPAEDTKDEYVLFSYRPLSLLARPNVRNVPTIDASPIGKLQKIRSFFWLQFILPRALKKEGIDVFFSPNTLLPFACTGAKNVITIHDMFHAVDPRFHSHLYNHYVSLSLARTVKNADHILAVSESTKADVIRLLGVPNEKITVTHLAAEERFAPREISPETRARYDKKYGLPERFILYVGVIERRKNIEGIIAIADVLKGKTEVPIILAGRSGYAGEQYLSQIKARANMRYLDFFDDADLPALYNLAELFLFPSLYEGFGLPPLEAMQSGVPVVASNTSSLPEILGDAAALFPPQNTHAIAYELLVLLNDPAKRKSMIQRGIAQARTMSFKKTAEQTLAIFQSFH